jgi:hypothetical protein
MGRLATRMLSNVQLFARRSAMNPSRSDRRAHSDEAVQGQPAATWRLVSDERRTHRTNRQEVTSIRATLPSKQPRRPTHPRASSWLLQQEESMSKFLVTAGLSLILASTAATAAPAAKQGAKAPQQKVCIKFADDTGSHLTRTECRTKSEWKQLGVDVDDLSSNDNH